MNKFDDFLANYADNKEEDKDFVDAYTQFLEEIPELKEMDPEDLKEPFHRLFLSADR